MKYFLSLLLLLLIGCGDTQLKNQVEHYKGEGEIVYKESFGVVGAPGVSVDFPFFSLKNNFSKSYNIEGIPTQNAYIVYFKTKKVKLVNLSPDGVLSYAISKNGKIISGFSNKIKNMIVTSSSNSEALYFNGDVFFNITNNNGNWKFTVSSKNILKNPQIDDFGYFCIKKSGGK